MFQRTGGVDEFAPGREKIERIRENGGLFFVKTAKIRRPEPPFNFRIARQSSSTRAGRIDQNPVKFSREGQRFGGIQNDPVTLRGDRKNPFGAYIAGDGSA